MERTFTKIPGAVKKSLSFFLLLFAATACFAQYNVTEVITDYGGYWKSSATANNSVKPDNSHNLVSFSFNGNRYSTGVNDALLVSRAQLFIPGDYRALPVSTYGAVTSNTKIGLGSMYDGVANGASSPAPLNNIPYYLTDGIKGLDLGTCVANLPAGTMNFPINQIASTSINDGIPDLVITQVADPSGSLDRYEFTDINGTVIGHYVDINLTNIPPVGNWTADFYEASQNPMTLSGGFTKTDRPIRLWASDLSSFGITSANAPQVAYFKILLSGNSDVAFVAYNNNSISIINALLPVKLNSFTGQEINKQAQLNWQTVSEINSDVFVVEKSNDGVSFTAIATVNASNNTNSVTDYIYTDRNAAAGKNYYRLKMVDKDGQSSYSKVVTVNVYANAATADMTMYPNPATNYITVNHIFSGNNEQLQVLNLQGNVLLQQKIATGSLQTKVDISSLPRGMYQLVLNDGKNISAKSFVVQ